MDAWDSCEPSFQNAWPGLDDAVRTLARWNGRADPQETGVALYARWQEACRRAGRTVNARRILTHQRLGDDTRRGLLEALGEDALCSMIREANADYPLPDLFHRRLVDYRQIEGPTSKGCSSLSVSGFQGVVS